MADKDKSKSAAPSKTVPKDGMVILAIMKEMGLTEYEPKTVLQLTEFVYRYTTTILEEARFFANNCKKRFIDVEDVRAALHLCNESKFTTPPSRGVILELSRNRNNNSLAPVKPQSGLRLPADRHCLTSSNYVLKSNSKKVKQNSMLTPGMKIVTKPTVSYIKRTNIPPLTKQTIAVPKGNIHNMVGQIKTEMKPKIQIQQSQDMTNKISTPMSVDRMDLKRKREDEDM